MKKIIVFSMFLLVSFRVSQSEDEVIYKKVVNYIIEDSFDDMFYCNEEPRFCFKDSTGIRFSLVLFIKDLSLWRLGLEYDSLNYDIKKDFQISIYKEQKRFNNEDSLISLKKYLSNNDQDANIRVRFSKLKDSLLMANVDIYCNFYNDSIKNLCQNYRKYVTMEGVEYLFIIENNCIKKVFRAHYQY